MSSSSSKNSQARLREALTAGGPSVPAKGPPQADGVLSVSPDTAEAIEWRDRMSVVDTIASSSSFLDDSDDGPPTSELYGKFTWKLDKFGDSGKRELRSNVFEVGSYKWYLLVYPHGCDVANHLSLFLCVADYDKLLPGWSHFAQFTIAVVNQDPKKSKYSDTLHRFCKKEHDWGWKKFMELSKVLDGFTTSDSLVIKAQVQVIRDRPQRPFKCLDGQYRRELVRVYLANVEGIVRRFVEEKREALQLLLDDGCGFKAFWRGLEPAQQQQLATEPAPGLFKELVKRFFNEKEVTSTLMMDALYCGAKLLEDAGRRHLQGAEGGSGSSGSAGGLDHISAPAGVLVDAARGVVFFAEDAVSVLERLVAEELPPFQQGDKQQADQQLLRTAQDPDDLSRDAIERGERRLADLGRRCVEVFAAAHIAATRLEVAYQEAEILKRQEALLHEEELHERQQEERQAARTEADRERRAKKKERAKRRKEAERSRREAEEAERAQQEEARRQEQLRKQQEVEERRRREQAEREGEQQRQRLAAKQAAQAKRQQQEAAKRARQQQDAAAAGVTQDQQQDEAAAFAAEPELACTASAHALADGGHNSAGSYDTATHQSPLSSLGSQTSDSGTGMAGVSTPPSMPSSRSLTPDAAAAATRGGGRAVHCSLHTDDSSLLSASEACSEASAEDEVEALRRQLVVAEAQLAAKDAQTAALLARVDELERQLSAAGLTPASSSSQSGSSRPGSSAATSRGGSAAASRPASAPLHHHRSLSSDRPISPLNGAADGSQAVANGLGSHSGAIPQAGTQAVATLSGAAQSMGPPQRQPATAQRPQHVASAPALLQQQGTQHATPINPAAPHFPTASSFVGASKQQGLTSGPKRTGYAAAAAGEPTGGHPSATNGAGSYRAASLAPAMSALSMGSASSVSVTAHSTSSSSRTSSDGMGAVLLTNIGSNAAHSASGRNGELYARPPPVVLPGEQPANGSFAASLHVTKRPPDAAMESPGFDDFAHMGLISDLLE